MGKPQTRRSQPVDVGSFIRSPSIGTKTLDPNVIGHNQDDVFRILCRQNTPENEKGYDCEDFHEN
jgi:hypothetical protein